MSKLMKSLNRLKKSVWGEKSPDRPEKKENLSSSEELSGDEEEVSSEEESSSNEKALRGTVRKSLGRLSKRKDEDEEEEEEEDEQEDEEEEEEEEDEEEEALGQNINKKKQKQNKTNSNLDDNDDEEADIPLSDVEIDDDADVVPHQKETVNNRPALKQALDSFALPTNSKFIEHMTITYEDEHEMTDIYDDMQRELAFYKQALSAAKAGKKQCQKNDIPFSRPPDFFAEMVKSDEHMDRLKQKLIDEETAKKASQEAKRQRELKKFGKKVQHAKLQERQKEKRDTMEKIKSLKRKRTNNEMQPEEFDIAIEEAADFRPSKSAKRKAKDSKYGHGGKKRLKNKNDAESSADLSGFNSRQMKAGAYKGGASKSKPKMKRPGRSRRNNRK